MKNYILIGFLCVLCFSSKAQITLEHIYDSASTFNNPRSQLMIIKFEITGERYVNINRIGKRINLYDINHSLIKSISYNSFPLDASSTPNFLYFSENLFNTDSKIEFMYVYHNIVGVNHTRVFNEDGTLIFQADSADPLILINTPLQQYPIYNTTQGTKMILSDQFTGKAKVYSLPGTLTTDIAEANGQLMQAQSGQLSKLYPNPSNGAVTLQYELPNGETEGELILYNMQGMEVKRYKIDNTFSDILLDNTQLPAGTYFYQLQTSKGAVGTKKMVIIK